MYVAPQGLHDLRRSYDSPGSFKEQPKCGKFAGRHMDELIVTVQSAVGFESEITKEKHRTGGKGCIRRRHVHTNLQFAPLCARGERPLRGLADPNEAPLNKAPECREPTEGYDIMCRK